MTMTTARATRVEDDEVRFGNWGQLSDGMRYDYSAGRIIGELKVEALAWAAAGKNRYNSWTQPYWSVASHECLVAEIIAALADYDLGVVLGGLHHDSHETLVGDPVSPFKWSWSDQMRTEWEAHARRAQSAILCALGIDRLMPSTGDSSRQGVIRAADIAALEAERRWLFEPRMTWVTEQIVNPKMLAIGERILASGLADVRGGQPAADRFVVMHEALVRALRGRS